MTQLDEGHATVTTKTIHLGDLPAPFGWRALRGWVDDITRREAAHEGSIQCVIAGSTLRAFVDRPLTLSEQLDEARAALERVTRERDALLAERRGITGSGVTGTQGPAAIAVVYDNTTPPPADEAALAAQAAATNHARFTRWRELVAQGGWRMPDHALQALTYARQQGMADLTAAEVEGWESHHLAPGSLGAAA
ncbi:MAG: hypothetical protein EKK62_12860 [Acidimicrobiia bacterium]|nr:MAG: hypothetical protein EKK62_12860 [Acidimicrobiia bacterium]